MLVTKEIHPPVRIMVQCTPIWQLGQARSQMTVHQGSGEESVNERIYRGDDGSWYYRARGNDAVGPYDSQEAAEAALDRQVQSWSGRGKPRTIWTQHLPSSKLFRRSATRHP